MSPKQPNVDKQVFFQTFSVRASVTNDNKAAPRMQPPPGPLRGALVGAERPVQRAASALRIHSAQLVKPVR
jgi:hypothetical protein